MNLSKEELDLLAAAVRQYEVAYGDWRKGLHWLTEETSRQLAVERESLQKLARNLKEEAGNVCHDLQCENKIVTFVYRNHRGDEESRTVTVHRLEIQSIDNDYYKRGTLLLQGYCHDRKAIRSFAFKNILTRVKPYMEEPGVMPVSGAEPAPELPKVPTFKEEYPLGTFIKCATRGVDVIYIVQGHYTSPEADRYLICKPWCNLKLAPELLLVRECYKAGGVDVATRG